MGLLFVPIMASTRAAAVVTFAVVPLLFDVLTSAQTCDSTLSGWPNTNRPAYCCPNAGDGTTATNTTRFCRKILPYNTNPAPTPYVHISDIVTTTTPNPCYWTNLAGQTPDTETVWNSAYKNFFTT